MPSDHIPGITPPEVPELRALLRRLHKNLDTDAIVDQLMHGYTSSRAMPDMEVNQLAAKLPLHTAELIHLIPELSRAVLRSHYPAHPLLNGLPQASHFLRSLFLGRHHEYCYLLLLRKNRYLIRARLMQSGTINSVPFYPRNILEVALANDADAVVLAHNHPGNIPEPSPDDIAATYELINALRPMEIPLLDHLIFTNDTVVSIRENQFVPEEIWMEQPNHCPRYLSTWLNPPVKSTSK
jgi:DNA repair protein RadC